MGCTKSKPQNQNQNSKKQQKKSSINGSGKKSNFSNRVTPDGQTQDTMKYPAEAQQEEIMDQEEEKKDNGFEFSKNFKFKKLQIKDKKICISKQDLHQYVLCEPGLDIDFQDKKENEGKIFSVKFKIKNFDQKYNMYMGVGHVETLEMGQFIKKKWFDEIDHGLYAIDDFGNCYSNVDEKFNNVKNVGWGYSLQNGCIIQIEVNVEERMIRFSKIFEQKEYNDFQMPFEYSQIRDEGDLHFFVCMGGQSEVQIMDE